MIRDAMKDLPMPWQAWTAVYRLSRPLSTISPCLDQTNSPIFSLIQRTGAPRKSTPAISKRLARSSNDHMTRSMPPSYPGMTKPLRARPQGLHFRLGVRPAWRLTTVPIVPLPAGHAPFHHRDGDARYAGQYQPQAQHRFNGLVARGNGDRPHEAETADYETEAPKKGQGDRVRHLRQAPDHDRPGHWWRCMFSSPHSCGPCGLPSLHCMLLLSSFS